MSNKNTSTTNARYTILLCDDDEFISSMYAFKFRQEGYKIIVVNSGDKVIPTMIERKINLVILDLMVPNMNGFEVLQELKKAKNPALQKIPIVAVSNLGQKSDIDTVTKLGVVDFIVKSNVTPKELLERIRKFLPAQAMQTTSL